MVTMNLLHVPKEITFVCIKGDRDNPISPEQIFILSIQAEVRQFQKAHTA